VSRLCGSSHRRRDESLAEARPHTRTLGFVLAHSCLCEWGIQSEILPRRGSSGSRDRTSVPCLVSIGHDVSRLVPNHTRTTIRRNSFTPSRLDCMARRGNHDGSAHVSDAFGGRLRQCRPTPSMASRALMKQPVLWKSLRCTVLRRRCTVFERSCSRLQEIRRRPRKACALDRCGTVAKRKTVGARAGTSLARFLVAQGNSIEARNLLAPIYSWYTEGFGTPDLKDAKLALDHLAWTESAGVTGQQFCNDFNMSWNVF